MKKLCLTLIICFALFKTSKAQLTIDSLSTWQTILNDTVPAGSSLQFSANVVYTSSTPFTGTIYLLCGVDSTNGLLSVDTIGFSNVVNIGLNDSTTIPISDSVIQQNGFRIGGNIVVVWPIANGLTTLDSFRTTIFVTPLPTSLNEQNNLFEQLLIYPNPTQNKLVIENNLTKNNIKHVRIYAINGSLIGSYSNSINEVDLSPFPNGIYFLKIELDSNEILNYKILKN